MLKWYYQMWSDGIYSLQKKKERDPTMLPWQVGSLTAVAFAQGTNWLTIWFWLRAVGVKYDILLNIDLFDVAVLDKFSSAFISLFLPFYIINYFLIFHKKRYEEIMKRFPSKNVKGLSMILYCVFSFALFLVPLAIMVILR